MCDVQTASKILLQSEDGLTTGLLTRLLNQPLSPARVLWKVSFLTVAMLPSFPVVLDFFHFKCKANFFPVLSQIAYYK